MNRMLARPLRSFLVLLMATQVGAQSTGPTFPNPGKTSMSREDQQALGMEVATQVYQQMPVLPDNSPESQYIRKLGQKLVATIPQQYSWPFEFHVIPQKEINAFALPGGQKNVYQSRFIDKLRGPALCSPAHHYRTLTGFPNR